MTQTLAEIQADMKARLTGKSEAIRRCPHSVYIPAGDKRALYCRLCTPEGPDAYRAAPAEAKKPRKKTKASTVSVQTPELSQTIQNTA
jgi:hypothetical protein